MITCDQKGCEAIAVCHPQVVLRPGKDVTEDPRWSEARDPIRYMMRINLCAEHQATMRLEDLLDDAWWARMERTVIQGGGRIPDREATTLEFIPIGWGYTLPDTGRTNLH